VEAPVTAADVKGQQPGVSGAAGAANGATAEKPCTFSCRVQYGSTADATMVQQALSVDPELRPALVTRKLSVDGCALVMEFAALDVRTLRAAVCTFCDLLGLATRTLEAFTKMEK